MDNVKQALDFLTPEMIFDSVKEVINDTLSHPDNSAQFTLFLTVGQFKEMKGFYGSKVFLKELTNAYIGRFTRFFMQSRNLPPKDGFEICVKSEDAEWNAVELLHSYFIKKWGEVPAERVKELDDIASAWQIQANEILKKMKEGASFHDTNID